VLVTIYYSLIRLLAIPSTIPSRIRMTYISSLLSGSLYLRINRVLKSKSSESITVLSILIIDLGNYLGTSVWYIS